MDAEPKTVRGILQNQQQYVVPIFQRFYQWDQTRWDGLWQDVQALLNEELNEPESEPLTHFIGPMVLVSKDSPTSFPKYMVIDGQQRLITLTLLLCALRDIAALHGLPEIAREIDQYLLFEDAKGRLQNKVMPRTSDQSVFVGIVRRHPVVHETTSLIHQCYMHFWEEINSAIMEYVVEDTRNTPASEYLPPLVQLITERLLLIAITLGERDDPAKIFESLNFKSEKLSDADLIRNYILMSVDLDDQDNFGIAQWQRLEQIFLAHSPSNSHKDVLEDFYYRYMISKMGYFPRAQLYGKFTRHMDKRLAEDRGANIELMVVELTQYAQYYIALQNPAEEPDDEIRRSFERLHVLEMTTAVPLLLALYHRYSLPPMHDDHINRDEFLLYLRYLESYILRRAICGESNKNYNRDLPRAVGHIVTLKAFCAYFKDRDWPTDHEVMQTLEEAPIYERDSRKTRLMLMEIERYYEHPEMVDLSQNESITIEHIMPQTLTPAWERDLGADWQDVHIKYRHTLGNLTLTGYNHELGNKRFSNKKKQVEQHRSHIQLTDQVFSKKRWGEKEIVQRSRELAKIVTEIWPRCVD